MPAVNRALYIEQGATYHLSFTLAADSTTTPGTPGDPYDLTGCEVRMQIRKTQQAEVLVEAVSTGASAEITLGGVTGVIDIKIPPAKTNLLSTKSALYDIELVEPDGDIYRIVEGQVRVSPNITQIPGEPVVGA